MESLDTFLTRHPPFDGLPVGEVRALADGADEQTFERGEAVLVEDGRPATHLYVIRSGSMGLIHEGEEMEVLQVGECFGHPSLLSGSSPVFTVRAREESTCALLEAEPAKRALTSEAGTAYVASTMSRRLRRTGQTIEGLRDVGTTPVSAIMRPPAFCDADEPLRAAALRLGEEGTSALIVRLDGGRLGIVTDAEVREAVASEDARLDAPAADAARAPAPTTPVGQLAIEATVDMLAAGSEHMVVLDERGGGGEGGVVGLLSAADLLGLDANSPIALRRSILRAADEDTLVRATAHLPKLFVLLVRAGLPPRDLGRVLSLHNDAVTARLIDFALSRHGPAPLPWVWLELGSAARREFTLASDQDNALAYATPEPSERASVDAYFERLAGEVNDGLVRCGIGRDNNGVLASSRLWRMSKADWLRTFDECLTTPDESHLIRASVAFDFRSTAGGLAVAAELSERIRAARGYPQFMRLMARTASGYEVALGFRGQFPKGRLDLKRGAVVPLVNLVRFVALANGVTISPTLDRIDALASVGGLERGAADALGEAFDVICRLRFQHHVALLSAGEEPDNALDPDALAPIERRELLGAMQAVRRAQRRLGELTPRNL